MMRAYFKNGSYLLTVTESQISDIDGVSISATNPSFNSSAILTKAQTPAFALAVLEAAGYTADNSCAGDAVRALKFQIANDARAAEEAALDKEAEALARTLYADSGFSFESSLSQGQWRAVARKARELHKTEAK